MFARRRIRLLFPLDSQFRSLCRRHNAPHICEVGTFSNGKLESCHVYIATSCQRSIALHIRTLVQSLEIAKIHSGSSDENSLRVEASPAPR